MKTIIPSHNNKVYLIDNTFIQKENANEANIYPILQKHKVPIVPVYNITKNTITLKYYPSKTLKEVPSKKLYEKVGRIYKKIHNIKGTSTTFHKTIQKQFAKLPKYMQQKLQPHLKNISGESLIHCDPSATNILIGKHIKLIDFEFTRFGDPLYDIALICNKHPPKYHKAFLKGYQKEIDTKQVLFYQILHANHEYKTVKNKPRFKQKRKQLRDEYYHKLLFSKTICIIPKGIRNFATKY